MSENEIKREKIVLKKFSSRTFPDERIFTFGSATILTSEMKVWNFFIFWFFANVNYSFIYVWSKSSSLLRRDDFSTRFLIKCWWKTLRMFWIFFVIFIWKNFCLISKQSSLVVEILMKRIKNTNFRNKGKKFLKIFKKEEKFFISG